MALLAHVDVALRLAAQGLIKPTRATETGPGGPSQQGGPPPAAVASGLPPDVSSACHSALHRHQAEVMRLYDLLAMTLGRGGAQYDHRVTQPITGYQLPLVLPAPPGAPRGGDGAAASASGAVGGGGGTAGDGRSSPRWGASQYALLLEGEWSCVPGTDTPSLASRLMASNICAVPGWGVVRVSAAEVRAALGAQGTTGTSGSIDYDYAAAAAAKASRMHGVGAGTPAPSAVQAARAGLLPPRPALTNPHLRKLAGGSATALPQGRFGAAASTGSSARSEADLEESLRRVRTLRSSARGPDELLRAILQQLRLGVGDAP